MSISVEQALERLLARCRRLGTERVALVDSLGRVLASDARSDIDIAPFDNSAMDGYAVRLADVEAASFDAPVSLEVVAHIPAGRPSPLAVLGGQAAKIMTGAPLPAGAEAVVMVEYTDPGEGGGDVGGNVLVKRRVHAGENVRRRGEEVVAGQTVVSRGEVVGPAAIGLLASAGQDTAEVFARPRVAILSTGDEIVDVSAKPGPGQIRDSNAYSLAAQVIAAGGVPLRYPVVRDDAAATEAAVERAVRDADFVVVSGGVSAGEHDHVRPVLTKMGELEFFKVAMRPGNPQTMAWVNDVPVFGLPGNPSSTFVGFEVFVRPALRWMQGHSRLRRPVQSATLVEDVKKKPDRRYYLRGKVERDRDGLLEASLTGSQSSALLTAAHKGNCLLVLPEGQGRFPSGSAVEVMRLDMEEGTA